MSRNNTTKDHKSVMIELSKVFYDGEPMSLEQIFREKITIQRESIFDALKDLFILTNEEYHKADNRALINKYLSPSEIEAVPTESEINDLLKSEEDDKKSWLRFIRTHAEKEWIEDDCENSICGGESNNFISFEKSAKAFAQNEWTLELIADKPASYGYCIFQMLDALLSIDSWDEEILFLAARIDDSTRYFYLNALTNYQSLITGISFEHKRIIEDEKAKIRNTKRNNTLSVTIGERHQGLLELIKKEAAKGKFRNLSQPRVTTLAKAIVLRVWAYNEDLEPENAISPADNQGIKSILIKRFGFRAQKDLPHNYIDILMS